MNQKVFYINNYYIPPFSLEKGEVLIIDIKDNIPFYKFELLLADIFSRKKYNENITVNSSFYFTGRVWHESWLRSKFNPTTVEEYLKRYTSDSKGIVESINNLDTEFFELRDLKIEDKMIYLEPTPFRLISLFATLTKCKYIFTDMMGQSPSGIRLTWDIINKNIENGSSFIILDHFGYSDYSQFAKKYKKIEL